MTLAAGQDFIVETQHGIIRCTPKTPAAASAFKVLQLALLKLLPQLPDAPAVSIDVDGTVGPSVTLATQVIAQRLASGKHGGLAELGGLQPEDAVPTVAAHAMEIAGYLGSVIEADPAALMNPQTLGEPIDPFSSLKGLFTGKRIAAVVGTLLGLGAFALLGAAADRRALGTIDRSAALPPSDGTDEFDDEGHDEDGDDGTGAYMAPEHDRYVPPANVIDVESVEVTSAAA